MAFQVSGDTVIDQNQSITSPKITLEGTSVSESILSGLLNGDSKLEIKADGSVTFVGGLTGITSSGSILLGQGDGTYRIVLENNSQGGLLKARDSSGTETVTIDGQDGSAIFDGSVESKNNFFVKAQANDQTCFRVTDLSGGTIRTNLRGDGGAEFASTVKIGNPSNPEIRLTGSGVGTFASEVVAGVRDSQGVFMTSGGALEGFVSGTRVYNLGSDGSATFNDRIKCDKLESSDNVISYVGIRPNDKSNNYGFAITDASTGDLVSGLAADGSAIFTGSVDVGGLTVNGAPVTGDVDLSGYDTSAEVDQKIANLVGTASSTLDTLGEIADALSDNQSVATSITVQLGLKANTSSLANVATSGSYTDLTNKPSIPTHTSSLTNNSGFITNTNSTFPSSYYEFGNGIGSVSNDGSWNARLNLAGSSHARLDVTSVSDGIITSIFSHTGNGHGRIGTSSNHPLKLMTGGNNHATLSTSGVLDTTSQGTLWGSSNDGSGSGLDADKLDGLHASSFLRSDANDTVTGQISFQYDDGTGAYKTLEVRGAGNHAGITINPHANKQAHLRFATNGDEKWQWRVPFQDSYEASMRLYSWVAGDDIYQFNHNGTATFNGGTVWTSANDGSGSGLDADKLDGQEGSYYLNYNNLSNVPSVFSKATTLDPGTSYQTSQSTTAENRTNGLEIDFVRSGEGWPSYGTVLTAKSYYGGGGTFQLYNGYGSDYGGNYLRYRTSDYNAGGAWTSWMTVWTSGNDGSGSGLDADLLDGLDSNAFVKQNESATLDVLGFSGVGGDSGNGDNSYAIYQAGGAWSYPFPDLVISYHTGIKIGGHTSYGGTRFYSDSPDASGASELFSVGNGDAHVRATNNIYTKGKLVSTNGVSSSAPSNPNTGDFWTDTSSDPPLLKSWNGSSWIEVGSAGGASGGAPVIDSLSLSEDNTSGARFTDKDFTGTVTMNTEGSPVSQKGIKGILQGNFERSSSITLSSATYSTSLSGTLSNQTGTGIWTDMYTNTDIAVVAAPDATAGPGFFYLAFYKSTNETTLLHTKSPWLPASSLGTFYTDRHYPSNIASRNGIYWTSNSKKAVVDGSFIVFDAAGSSYYLDGSLSNEPCAACDGNIVYKITGTSTSSTASSVLVAWGNADQSPFTGGGVSNANWNNSKYCTVGTSTQGATSIQYNDRNCKIVYDEPSDRLLVMVFNYANNNLHTGVYTINRTDYTSNRLNAESYHVQTISTSLDGNYYFGLDYVADCGPHGAALVTHDQGLYFWNSSTKTWEFKRTLYTHPTYTYNHGSTLSSDKDYIYYNDASNLGTNSFRLARSYDKGITSVHVGSATTKHYNSAFNTVLGIGHQNGWVVAGFTTDSNSNLAVVEYRTITSNSTQCSISDNPDFTTTNFPFYVPIRKGNDPYNQKFWGLLAGTPQTSGNIHYQTIYVNGEFEPGDIVETMLGSNVQNSTRYLVLNSIGEVSSIVTTDPGFVQQGPGLTHKIKFPSLLHDRSPDDLIASGVSLRMEVQATNSAASDTYLSNSVTPT